MRKGFLLSLLCCLSSVASFAATYYYQSGAFNTASNWNTNTDGTGSPASDFTSGATDIWVLQAAGTFTVNAAWTVTGSLQIDGTCTITTNPSIGGGITVSSGGTLNQNVAATAVLPNMAAVQSGTIVYGTVNHTLPAGITYNNITINPLATVSASGDITVNGALTVNSGKTLSMSVYQLVAGTSFVVASTGTITTANSSSTPVPSGYVYTTTVNYNGTGAQTVVAGTYANLTVSGARGGADITFASGNVRVGNGTSGVFTLSATGVGNYITTGNTFLYGDTNGGMTVASAIPYNNLTFLNTSGSQTAGGDITVNGVLTTTAGGSFSTSTFQLLGSFTVSNAGTISSAYVGSNPFPSGVNWGTSAGTVAYAAAGATTIMAGTYYNMTITGNKGASNITFEPGTITLNGTTFTGSATSVGGYVNTGNTVVYNRAAGGATLFTMPVTYNNVTFANTSATYSVSTTGAMTIDGTLTTTAGGTVALQTTQLSGTLASISNSGTITTTNTGATPIPANLDWGTTGTITFATTTTNQTVPTGTYNNLTSGHTTGHATVTGDITVNGKLTTTTGAGGYLDLSTFNLIAGASFTVTNNGTIKTANTSGTPIPSPYSWSGTTGVVEYNGTGAQTVALGTYKALTISQDRGGASVTLPVGTIDLTGNFSPTATTVSYITTGNTVRYTTLAGSQTVGAIPYNNLTFLNTSGTDNAGGDITVGGTLTTTSGGTFSLGTNQLLGTPTITNNGTITTLNTGSTPLPTGLNWGTSTGTVSYAATGATTVMAGTYNNLTITGAKGTNNITLESGSIVVNGTPTGGATGVSGYTTTGNTFVYNKASGGALLPLAIPYNNLTVANTSGSYTLAPSTNLTVNGDFTTSTGGTLALATNQFLGNPTSITHSGTITTTNTGSNPFPSGLNWAANGGTGTISYGGTTTATIVTGTYYNLTTTGAHVANAVTLESGNITVNNTLNWGASTTSYVNTGNTLVLNNTGGSGTSINSTALTLNNLTLNNTSSSYKAGAGLVVNGALTTTAGGTLDMQSSTLTGSLTAITNNGTIRTASTTNPPFVSGKDWGSAGTITYSATTGAQAVPAGTYNNLTFLNTSGTATVVGTPTINGMLTTTAGGTLSMTTFAPTGTFSVTNNGTISTTNTTATPLPTGMDWTANGGTGTVSYGGTTTATVMAGTYYNLTTTGAHTTNAVTLESGNIQVNNTLSWGASSSNFVNTGNTLILNNAAGNGANINSTALTLNNLTLNNTSSSYKAGGNLVVNGNLITTAGGTLDMQVSTLTGTLGTITNNGTIRTASTTNPAIASGKTWGGTVIFSATTGAQSIPAATFNNLTVLNTSATNTVVGTITVNGVLTTTAGGTLSMTTFQLAGTPTLAHFGTISTTNTGSNPFPSDLDWTNGGGTGTVSYGGTTTATIVTGTYYNLTATGAHVANTITLASGNIIVNNNLSWTATTSSYATTGNTLTLNSATGSVSTINTGALTFNNLTLNNTSGTYTAGAALTVNGVLTSAAGGALVMGTNALTLGGSASTSGTGAIRTANITATPVTASKTWTQTLEFNSASAQTIVGGTYGGLVLSNANTKTVSNDVNVTGDLTIGSSNTLADGGKIVTVSGNILGSGIHSGAGKIVMNGASKTISGATLGNLQLNNAAGFSLTGDPTINGTLTFTAGNLDLGANNLTFGTASATAAASSSSMIVATGVGEVRRNYAANGSFTFPIGDNIGPNYSPISVNFTGGTYGGGAYASAKVTNAVHPQNYSGTDYLTRYWTVNTSNITSPSYAVSATYVPGDVVGTESLIYMGEYSSSTWTQHNVTNTSTHTLSTNTNVTATSADFTGVGGPGVSVNSATVCITGTVNLTASSSTPFTPVTYSWTPSTDLSASTGATVTASPTVTTVYTVTVTDSHGLTGTGTATVTVVAQPSVNIGLSATGNICPTTVLTLTATPSDGTGTADYKWSGPGISGTPSSGSVASYTTIPSSSYTTIPPTAAGEYTVVLTYSGAGCSTVSATSSTITPSVHQWEGGASGDVNNWSNASNWVCGGVPAVSDHILIPNRTNQPTLAASTTASMARLYVSSGATLTMGASSTVNLSGDFTNYGTITGPSTAKVVLNGSSAQNIGGGGNISNLELNNSAGATIANVAGDSTTVKGTLTLTSGTLTTNDKLMLYADATTNGRIGEITGGDISGNIVTQMWFQTVGHKAWHFFSHPFDNFIPLSMLQSSINMTGPGGSTNGWTTAASNEPSSYYITPGTGWVAFNSSSDHLNRHQGIRLFVWGNIDEGIWGGTTSTSVRMRLYGHPNTGTQNVTLVKAASGSAVDYNQVANPYPSPVNIGQVIKDAFDLGKVVGPSYWLWNPALGTNGQYVTKAIDGSAFYISSGNSVQVRTTTNGNTLIFNESHKGTTPSLNLRTYSDGINLTVYDATYHPWDMLSVKFDQESTEREENVDAGKPDGPADLNFYAISSDNVKLSSDVRPYAAGKVIPLGIGSNVKSQFILKADKVDVPTGSRVYLHDKLLNKYQLLTQGAEYPFAINENGMSQGDNRFELTMAEPHAFDLHTNVTLEASLAPNPAVSEVAISYSTSGAENTVISVADVSGHILFTKDAGAARDGKVNVPLSQFASGVYLVTITSGDAKIEKTLIKE